jgi:hypothetical protein
MKRIGVGTICLVIANSRRDRILAGPVKSSQTNIRRCRRHREPEVKPPRAQDEAKPPKQPPEAKPPKTEKQETPSSRGQQEPAHEQHGTSAQQQPPRPTGKSAHIADPKFKANFGKQHTFTVNRVITTNTVVPNQTRFIYAGYTFIFVDPWPGDWLFTDECYVDYVDEEYFLFDVLHPGVRMPFLSPDNREWPRDCIRQR